MRILVLEPNEKGKKITETLLEDRKDILFIFLQPEDVINVLEKEKFDVILIPLKMEGMDPFAFCRKIKQFNPNCILYAYSWFLQLYDPDTLEDIGFDGFIKRPTKKETLSRAVAGAMSRLIKTASVSGRTAAYC